MYWPPTYVSCLRDKDAEAVLELQAGFRPDYYAPEIENISFFEYLLDTIDTFVSSVWLELGVNYVDLTDWTNNALYNEIKRCLESVEKGQARPTTGNIDFCAAKKPFEQVKNKIVITKVDKAANCLGIMYVSSLLQKGSYAGVR